MLDELEWPSQEASREQSSLTFFHKIHSDTMSLNIDRYLTPMTSSIQTSSSKLNSNQCRRYQAYSDALKNSFFPRTITQWNTLPSSVVDANTAKEFKAHTV